MADPKRETPGAIPGTGRSDLGDARRRRHGIAQTSGGLERGHRHGDAARRAPAGRSGVDHRVRYRRASRCAACKQMDDYAKFVPGLSLGEREPGGTTIVFRGVASSGLQFGAVSSSALYLDEQPITQSGRNPDPRLIDIERVEALRGPQGTLYGASSQSGHAARHHQQAGSVRASTPGPRRRSRVSTTAARATTSAPWSTCRWSQDRLALRLVGFTAEDAGFIDNVLSARARAARSTTPTWSTRTSTRSRRAAARAALRLDVTDNVERDAGALFQDVCEAGRPRRRQPRRRRPEAGALRGREPRRRVVPVALTLNARCRSATWSSRRRTSTATSATRRTPPTTSSASTRTSSTAIRATTVAA